MMPRRELCTNRKAYVNTDNVMDFLKQIVASAPDMPEETDEPKPKAKRKRCSQLFQ